MASIREYCEMLSTHQLQALLREEYEGRGDLPVETILLICSILADRDPKLPSMRDTVMNICRTYVQT